MNVIQFDKKCKCGSEFVCVRILENCDNLKVGGIWLPTGAMANDRLAFCIIEDVGDKAAAEYGLDVGDYVLIDRLSTFAHTYPVALLKYNSVIMKTNKDRTEHYPLRNMLFVEPDEKEAVSNVGGIYLTNYDEKLNLGTILKCNFDKTADVPFKEGDRVMLVKGGDVVQLGEKTIYIYKHDMVICTIED